ncbi:MAG: ATP-binding protein, partial [Candidatus Aminicenantes bacterium]|nr:ATP-binding protein [Candidatus Aminicenantes bacterium]
FYGREQVINESVDKIEKNNLLVVTGISGAGKSSVVKAGLVPILRRQGYDILAIIRPGKTSPDDLEKIVQEAIRRDDGPPTALNPGNEETVLHDGQAHKKLLVIDQLEELITQTRGEEDKNRFMEILKESLDNDKSNILKIILTVRSDFEPHFMGPELKSYWPDARYMLPQLTSADLREIILMPTKQVIMEFEPPELVDRIIDEVNQAPGALPLLSFTLSELYRSYIKSGRENRTLYEEDYKKLRGVSGALNKKADELFNTLDDKQKNTLQKIMLRLVSIEGSEPARKKIPLDELNFSHQEENKRVEFVIDKLLEARLIIKENGDNNQNYIEPAHDALINSWVAVRGWLNNDGKEKIILQNRLEAAVKDYSLFGKKKLWHDDRRLDDLKKELDSPSTWLNQKEEKFIRESIRH